jgi:hypothetical protein
MAIPREKNCAPCHEGLGQGVYYFGMNIAILIFMIDFTHFKLWVHALESDDNCQIPPTM